MIPTSAGLTCLRPHRAYQLDSPERSAEVEGLLGLDERWSLAAENPHMRIRRLFADERRKHAAQTPELDLQYIVSRPAACATRPESFLPSDRYGELHESRLRLRSNDRVALGG